MGCLYLLKHTDDHLKYVHLVRAHLEIVVRHQTIESFLQLSVKRHISLPAELEPPAVVDALGSLAGAVHVERVERVVGGDVGERVPRGAVRPALGHAVPVRAPGTHGATHQRAALEPVLLVVRDDSRRVELVVADVHVLRLLRRQLGADESDKQ